MRERVRTSYIEQRDSEYFTFSLARFWQDHSHGQSLIQGSLPFRMRRRDLCVRKLRQVAGSRAHGCTRFAAARTRFRCSQPGRVDLCPTKCRGRARELSARPTLSSICLIRSSRTVDEARRVRRKETREMSRCLRDVHPWRVRARRSAFDNVPLGRGFRQKTHQNNMP